MNEVQTGRGTRTNPATSCWTGWTAEPRPADSVLKRRLDRVLPLTGPPAAAYIAAAVAALVVASILPERASLVAYGVVGLLMGGVCALGFWRCRQAHCVVSGYGWLAFGGFALVEAWLGRSVIGGYEGLVFLGILLAALAFEGVWYLVRGTNVLARSPRE